MLAFLQLTSRSDKELAGCDPAEVNLLCAHGCPGAENLDIPKYTRTLDQWAEIVRKHTHRCEPEFLSRPGEFNNSWAIFQMVDLCTVLQRDLGIRYNPELVERDDFFKDARNLFIHGVIDSRMGTCTNLPVLYLAIGRRLGYPLQLVATKSHLFIRWQDHGERFNIECTAKGFLSRTDGYYMKWPFAVNEKEKERYRWIVSKTPKEELAAYLTARGHCWRDNKNHKAACAAYAFAANEAPRELANQEQIFHALQEWRMTLEAMRPPYFPGLTMSQCPQRFPNLSTAWEHELNYLDVFESILCSPDEDRKWWSPQRRFPLTPLPNHPAHISVDRTPSETKITYHMTMPKFLRKSPPTTPVEPEPEWHYKWPPDSEDGSCTTPP